MYNPMMASFLIIYDNDKLAKLGIYLELDVLVVKLSHQANYTNNSKTIFQSWSRHLY